MIEVEIQNFQSIDKVAFKIEGFTVLVGRSNIGKSALIRAIQCALTGASGTDFVRHGIDCERRVKGNKKCKCKSSVSFKTEDLHLIWEKGDADNQYTLVKDGVPTTFTAVNRGTPDFLLPDFAQVAIGDTTELIQVSEQFSPIFLLNKSGSVIADVLSDVAKLDDINVAMKLVATDRREAVTTRNVRDKDVVQLKADLRQYDGLDAVVARATAIQDQHVALQELEQQVAEVDGFLEALREIAQTVRELTRGSSVTLPEATAMQKLGRDLLDIQRFTAAVSELKPTVQRLVGIGKVSTPEIGPLKTGFEEAARLNAWAQRIAKLEAVLAKDLSKLPEPDAATLTATVKSFTALTRWSTRYEALVSKVSQLDAQLTAVTAEEAEVLSDFADLGVCPTCSLPLHPEHRESA